MRKGTCTRLLFALMATALAASGAAAQQAPATLSLDDALTLARRNNPSFRAQANDEAVAEWNVRSTYGSALPWANASTGMSWRAGGTRRIENIDLGLKQPDQMTSGYSLSVGLSLSGATLFNMAEARAQRTATIAGIEAAEYNLEASVTRQYLLALRSRDAVILARRDLESAEQAAFLAEARIAAGAAARVDAAQALVEKGRAEVGVLQAEAAEEVERLRLFQVIGVDFQEAVDLTSEFRVFEPTWSLEQLTAEALAQHPQLTAARASESASRASARAARMSYLPSLNISGGWSGFTQKTLDEDYLLGAAADNSAAQIESCQRTNDLYSRLANPLPARDCSAFAFTDADRQQILADNRLFPFDFTKSPPSFNMSLSFPLLNGFQREAQVQRASAAAEDARHLRREQELRLRTELATTYLGLRTAYRSVEIEARNVTAAAEQLELQRERYRLGAGSILELTQAQGSKARADQAHLAALYSFHETLAALEAAVGRPLR